MIQAYSHVPRPYGTIFTNEIFSSGVLLSDTDFRQFEYHLNVTGLDIHLTFRLSTTVSCFSFRW
ncbi:uncharacterized protein F5147DRAFT_719683, partial [Suillus discolor]